MANPRTIMRLKIEAIYVPINIQIKGNEAVNYINSTPEKQGTSIFHEPKHERIIDH
jgi:hypothetical protein